MHQHPTEVLQVGTPIWFLQYAQENDEPMAATVLKMSANMVSRISFIDPDGNIGYRSAVYPLGHSSLVDDRGQPSMNARKNGAWTYNPLFVPRQKKTATTKVS